MNISTLHSIYTQISTISKDRIKAKTFPICWSTLYILKTTCRRDKFKKVIFQKYGPISELRRAHLTMT